MDRPTARLPSSRADMLFLGNRTPSRDHHLDCRARICVQYAQISSVLIGAFPHACQTNAQTTGSHLRNFPADSLPIIGYCYQYLIFLPTEPNRSLTRSRMPEHVG